MKPAPRPPVPAPRKDPMSRIADSFEELIRFLKADAESTVGRKLDQIITMLEQSKGREIQMALDLTGLAAAVAKDTEVDTSAITLLNGLTALIADLKTKMIDPADIQLLADFQAKLTSNQQVLADAVTANTPAAP